MLTKPMIAAAGKEKTATGRIQSSGPRPALSQITASLSRQRRFRLMNTPTNKAMERMTGKKRAKPNPSMGKTASLARSPRAAWPRTRTRSTAAKIDASAVKTMPLLAAISRSSARSNRRRKELMVF